MTHTLTIKLYGATSRQFPIFLPQYEGCALHLKSSVKGSRGHVHVMTWRKKRKLWEFRLIRYDSALRGLPLRWVRPDHSSDGLCLADAVVVVVVLTQLWAPSTLLKHPSQRDALQLTLTFFPPMDQYGSTVLQYVCTGVMKRKTRALLPC